MSDVMTASPRSAAIVALGLLLHLARPSLEERYGTHAAYVAKVEAAAQRLVEQRFLLQDDADRVVKEADASRVLQ